MQSALKLKATVLPGKRVEFIAPELTEGECIEVIVLTTETDSKMEAKQGVWDFIQSLPPSTLTMEEWERIEREFQEDRNAWGD